MNVKTGAEKKSNITKSVYTWTSSLGWGFVGGGGGGGLEREKRNREELELYTWAGPTGGSGGGGVVPAGYGAPKIFLILRCFKASEGHNG